MALLRWFFDITGGMPGFDLKGRMLERIIASMIVKCRIQTESDVTRSQESSFLSVLWKCMALGQTENKTNENCGLVTNDYTDHEGD